MGTVAQMALDHPRPVWATFGKHLQQTQIVQQSQISSTGVVGPKYCAQDSTKFDLSLPPPKRHPKTCDESNEGSIIPYKICRIFHYIRLHLFVH